MTKFIILLIATTGPLPAALLAHFHTDRGTVEVEMQYAVAPQAVANFITLAQGTRPWLDHATGAIRKDPYYNGTKIHRISNNASFRFAQGGSRKGDGSDGPGYTFKDEFSDAVTHVPYVLSMANAGPNTNGGQFFFTGNLSQPTFNKVHTVAGLVTDPASRSVVNAMITAGPNATVITGITFERTDPDAVAFDELDQGLPIVSQPEGSMEVVRSVSNTWTFGTALGAGSIFRAFRSPTPFGPPWTQLADARQQVGILPPGAVAPVASTILDTAEADSAFYNLSLAAHPEAVAPTGLASRTVTIAIGNGSIAYAFDASGKIGTLTFTPSTGNPVSGSFITLDPISGLAGAPYSNGAHDINFDTFSLSLNPSEIWIRIGCDSATDTLITGHYSTQQWIANGWEPMGKGVATITR